MDKCGDADPRVRPQGFMEEHCKNLHRASNVEADSSDRPKLSSLSILPGFSPNLMGNGVASADELEEVHTGPNRADVRIECLG